MVYPYFEEKSLSEGENCRFRVWLLATTAPVNKGRVGFRPPLEAKERRGSLYSQGLASKRILRNDESRILSSAFRHASSSNSWNGLAMRPNFYSDRGCTPGPDPSHKYIKKQLIFAMACWRVRTRGVFRGELTSDKQFGKIRRRWSPMIEKATFWQMRNLTFFSFLYLFWLYCCWQKSLSLHHKYFVKLAHTFEQTKMNY